MAGSFFFYWVADMAMQCNINYYLILLLHVLAPPK